MTLQWWLLAVTLAFAFVNGVNDGGSLLAVGLGVRGVRPAVGITVLSLAVVVTPLLVGTRVATTLAERLVDLDGDAGRLALLMAVGIAVVVTLVLSRRGLPTSLTLALIGAIAGVGTGAGLAVSWPTIGLVLAFAAAAPSAGLLAGWGLVRMLAVLPASAPLSRRVRRGHLFGFGLLCLAYGANDGQKMLAIGAVAAGTSTDGVTLPTWLLVAIGAIFFLGAFVGLPSLARTLGGGVVPVNPPDAVVTELSSAGVVLASAAAGSPVSMTQTITGAQVGTAITRGHGRVRWPAAGRVASAWVLTLPASFGLAAASSLFIG